MADTKVSDLVAAAEATAADLLYLVDEATTSKKVTFANFESSIDHGNLTGLSTGADHSYLDQDVTIGSGPAFTSIALTTPVLGTVTSGDISACTSTSLTMVTPVLGTPTSGVLTNCTGTAAGLTAGNVTTNANLTGDITSVGNATSLGSFSSNDLLTALTDETGTGVAVFGTSPTLTTPALGTPSACVLTNATALPAAQVAAGTFAGALEAADHGTAATDQIVNVCYGTGAPPTANTTTIGSLFIQYTA